MRLASKDKVKVQDSCIIFTDLHTKKASIIMTDIIVRVDIKSNVIVFHGTAEIILTIACKGSVKVKSDIFRFLENCFIICMFSIVIVFPLHK